MTQISNSPTRKDKFPEILKLIPKADAQHVLCLVLLGIVEALRENHDSFLQVGHRYVLNYEALSLAEDHIGSPELTEAINFATQIDDCRRFDGDAAAIERISTDVREAALKLLNRAIV